MANCLTPVQVKNPMFGKLLNQQRYMYVPCNHCIECLKKVSDEWTIRCMLEARTSDSSFFVTLTYNDDNCPDCGVYKPHIQNFHKRLRKAGFSFKYCLISEYGSHTHRPHYHGLYFGLPDYVFDEFWLHGYVMVKPINDNNIRYVCGYHILKNEFIPQGDFMSNFKLCSKNLGLYGFIKYELRNALDNNWMYIVDDQGGFHSIPRYFRKKFDVTFEPSFTFDYGDVRNFNSRNANLLIYKRNKYKQKQI